MKKLSFFTIYYTSKFVRGATFTFINLLFLPLAVILLPLVLLFNVRFLSINDTRIGHLAGDSYTFLNKLKKNQLPKLKYIGVASNKPCNRQLLRMFGREMTILQLPKSIRHSPVFRSLHNTNSIISKLGIFTNLPTHLRNYVDLHSRKPLISFNSDEKERGKNLLKSMGVDNWFVCIHSRDPAYLKKKGKRNFSHHNYRDCNIKNYIMASQYIAKQKGYAIRMGNMVEKKLPKFRTKRIIDYATRFRSEFGDIYVPANCKFFLGNTAGIIVVSKIFQKPSAIANQVPLIHPPLRKGDLFVPKKVWHKKEKRVLTFKEIIDIELSGGKTLQEKYEKAGVKLIENTPEEILDLAVEMNKRIDGTWKTTKEDEKLQRKFLALLEASGACNNQPSRICAKFLRDNKNLLD